MQCRCLIASNASTKNRPWFKQNKTKHTNTQTSARQLWQHFFLSAHGPNPRTPGKSGDTTEHSGGGKRAMHVTRRAKIKQKPADRQTQQAARRWVMRSAGGDESGRQRSTANTPKHTMSMSFAHCNRCVVARLVLLLAILLSQKKPRQFARGRVAVREFETRQGPLWETDCCWVGLGRLCREMRHTQNLGSK